MIDWMTRCIIFNQQTRPFPKHDFVPKCTKMLTFFIVSLTRTHDRNPCARMFEKCWLFSYSLEIPTAHTERMNRDIAFAATFESVSSLLANFLWARRWMARHREEGWQRWSPCLVHSTHVDQTGLVPLTKLWMEMCPLLVDTWWRLGRHWSEKWLSGWDCQAE